MLCCSRAKGKSGLAGRESRTKERSSLRKEVGTGQAAFSMPIMRGSSTVLLVFAEPAGYVLQDPNKRGPKKKRWVVGEVIDESQDCLEASPLLQALKSQSGTLNIHVYRSHVKVNRYGCNCCFKKARKPDVCLLNYACHPQFFNYFSAEHTIKKIVEGH